MIAQAREAAREIGSVLSLLSSKATTGSGAKVNIVASKWLADGGADLAFAARLRGAFTPNGQSRVEVEVGGWKSEVKRSEVGGGGWKSEVGGRRSEVGG